MDLVARMLMGELRADAEMTAELLRQQFVWRFSRADSVPPTP
jgi:hypothetical protein